MGSLWRFLARISRQLAGKCSMWWVGAGYPYADHAFLDYTRFFEDRKGQNDSSGNAGNLILRISIETHGQSSWFSAREYRKSLRDMIGWKNPFFKKPPFIRPD